MNMYTTLPPEIRQRAQAIRLLILDVDGVLTDGKLLFDEQGREYKFFHARDGHGIKLLQQNGIRVAIISGRKSPAVALRMQNLGVELVYQGYEDKLGAFNELRQQLELQSHEIAHVGDDLPDLPLLQRSGLAVAVADAHPMVRAHTHWTTALAGGNGAVREVCDLLMEVQGKTDAILSSYLQ